jgi:hypothetical protein
MKKGYFNVLTLGLIVFIASPLLAHGETMVVNLKGKAHAFLRSVPSADGGRIQDALCFRVPLFDVPTGLRIGVGLDCLSNVVDDGDGGVTVTDTTIFRFGRKNGRLVSEGRVTIRPVKDTESTPNATHITGSIPKAGVKTIITLAGTKTFKGRTGAVRLSGSVNMSEFNLNPGDPITFDCLFVIKVDGDSQKVSDDNLDGNATDENDEKDKKESEAL